MEKGIDIRWHYKHYICFMYYWDKILFCKRGNGFSKRRFYKTRKFNTRK